MIFLYFFFCLTTQNVSLLDLFFHTHTHTHSFSTVTQCLSLLLCIVSFKWVTEEHYVHCEFYPAVTWQMAGRSWGEETVCSISESMFVRGWSQPEGAGMSSVQTCCIFQQSRELNLSLYLFCFNPFSLFNSMPVVWKD